MVTRGTLGPHTLGASTQSAHVVQVVICASFAESFTTMVLVPDRRPGNIGNLNIAYTQSKNPGAKLGQCPQPAYRGPRQTWVIGHALLQADSFSLH